MTATPMQSYSLIQLVQDADAVISDSEITVIADPAWAQQGESRISYAGLLRLVECSRELQWQRLVDGTESCVDSITRCIAGDFLQPVRIHSPVVIRSFVTCVGNSSYTLQVELSIRAADAPSACVELVCVTINPETLRPVKLPEILRDRLLRAVADHTATGRSGRVGIRLYGNGRVPPPDCDM
jgi:acyl-CoA thioesterase FadM